MWRISLLMNAMLMVVFGMGSGASQIKLCAFHREPVALPILSEIAQRIQWLYVALPAAWAILTLAVITILWKRPEPRRDVVQLHTSATLFVGLFMLAFFLFAGIIPFVSICA